MEVATVVEHRSLEFYESRAPLISLNITICVCRNPTTLYLSITEFMTISHLFCQDMAHAQSDATLKTSLNDQGSNENEPRSLTGVSSVCLVPRNIFVGIAGQQHSRSTCLTISDNEMKPFGDADAAIARIGQEKVTLHFHMDSKGWDVITKEVMDWRDSSWNSIHLQGDRMGKLAFL